MPGRRACLALVVVALTAGSARAQDSLPAARELYTSASYEEALAALNRLRASGVTAADSSAIDQYRAFCLLALGRSAEAQDAIAAVVTASPSYVPSEVEASPRVRSAFSEVRRRVLPGIAQQMYADAKAAFDRKEFVAARQGFAQVLTFLADPDLAPVANQPPLADVRTLAKGFQDLSAKAQEAPPPPPPAPLVPPAQAAPPPPVAAPEPPPVYTSEAADVVPPVPVRQTMPPYPSRLTTPSQLILEVVISESGGVQSAVLRGPVDPTYDRLVLEAARKWLYKPATRDGVAVKYRRTIRVNLAPPSAESRN